QLLDDSVALHRLRMNWRHGSLHVKREYRFDTSLGGNDRRAASITLLGDRIVSASLPESDVPVLEPASAARVVHDIAPNQAGVDAGNNVVPITRAPSTLHRRVAPANSKAWIRPNMDAVRAWMTPFLLDPVSTAIHGLHGMKSS